VEVARARPGMSSATGFPVGQASRRGPGTLEDFSLDEAIVRGYGCTTSYAGVSAGAVSWREKTKDWQPLTGCDGRLMLPVLGGLAEFERQLIRVAENGNGPGVQLRKEKA